MSLAAFKNGVPDWDTQKWRDFIATEKFIQGFVNEGTIDVTKLISEISVRGYLRLLDECAHLVVMNNAVIHADTKEGKEILHKAFVASQLPLETLVKADVLSSAKADDLIQEAIAIADEFLRPSKKKMWSDDAIIAAMHWTPDQWRESMKYVEFGKNWTKKGILDSEKIVQQMPDELYDRMIERAWRLMPIGRHIYDAATDAGSKVVQKAVADGECTLAAAIRAGVYTKEEAEEFHHAAVQFAKEHLSEGSVWPEALPQSVLNWIPAQWDAFVDTPEFDQYIVSGMVDSQRLKDHLGIQMYNTLIEKAPTLIEIGPRVVVSTVAEGRACIQDAFSKGDITLHSMIQARLLSEEEADSRIDAAAELAKEAFEEGWSDDAKAVAFLWTPDEWDYALESIGFVRQNAGEGVVRIEGLRESMGDELLMRMVHQATNLVAIGDHVVAVDTPKGKEFALEGLWQGDVTVAKALQLEIITRDQATAMYDEVRTIAKEHFKKDVLWPEDIREAVVTWSADQWKLAFDIAEFQKWFDEEGKIARENLQKMVGEDVLKSMVAKTEFLVEEGDHLYDAGSCQGWSHTNVGS